MGGGTADAAASRAKVGERGGRNGAAHSAGAKRLSVQLRVRCAAVVVARAAGHCQQRDQLAKAPNKLRASTTLPRPSPSYAPCAGTWGRRWGCSARRSPGARNPAQLSKSGAASPSLAHSTPTHQRSTLAQKGHGRPKAMPRVARSRIPMSESIVSHDWARSWGDSPPRA